MTTEQVLRFFSQNPQFLSDTQFFMGRPSLSIDGAELKLHKDRSRGAYFVFCSDNTIDFVWIAAEKKWVPHAWQNKSYCRLDVGLSAGATS